MKNKKNKEQYLAEIYFKLIHWKAWVYVKFIKQTPSGLFVAENKT